MLSRLTSGRFWKSQANFEKHLAVREQNDTAQVASEEHTLHKRVDHASPYRSAPNLTVVSHKLYPKKRINKC